MQIYDNFLISMCYAETMKKCPFCKSETIEKYAYVPELEIGSKRFSLNPRDIPKCKSCKEEILDSVQLIKIDLEFCEILLNEPLDGEAFCFCIKSLRLSKKNLASELRLSEETIGYMKKTNIKLPNEINLFLKEKLKAERNRDFKAESNALLKHLTSLICQAKNEETKKKLKLN